MQSYNSRRSFTELADLRLIYYGVSCSRLGERVKSCCQHISVHGGCPWRRVSLCLTVVSVSFVSSGLTYCPAAQRGWSDTRQLSQTPARRREDILRLRCFLLCANNNTCIIHIQSCLHLILSVFRRYSIFTPPTSVSFIVSVNLFRLPVFPPTVSLWLSRKTQFTHGASANRLQTLNLTFLILSLLTTFTENLSRSHHLFVNLLRSVKVNCSCLGFLKKRNPIYHSERSWSSGSGPEISR